MSFLVQSRDIKAWERGYVQAGVYTAAMDKVKNGLLLYVSILGRVCKVNWSLAVTLLILFYENSESFLVMVTRTLTQTTHTQGTEN